MHKLLEKVAANLESIDTCGQTVHSEADQTYKILKEVMESPEAMESKGLTARPKPVRCFIDGAFDLIHSGHYNAIRQSAKICDELVVGCNSDVDVLKFKGPTILN